MTPLVKVVCCYEFDLFLSLLSYLPLSTLSLPLSPFLSPSLSLSLLSFLSLSTVKCMQGSMPLRLYWRLNISIIWTLSTGESTTVLLAYL